MNLTIYHVLCNHSNTGTIEIDISLVDEVNTHRTAITFLYVFTDHNKQGDTGSSQV